MSARNDEEERLRTLYAYGILDTIEEQSFDDICRLCAQICDVPISLISLIDRRRQWFKAHIGLEERETERECSFCAHAIESNGMLLVPDATQDARFVDNRLVLAGPTIRFYAGVPVRARNGMNLGTLCAIDRVPRHLSEDQRRALEALARQVEVQLELHRVQREKDQLGRFIAHDLRNPLAGLVLTMSHVAENMEAAGLQSDALADVDEGINAIHRMVEDLQDIYACEQGQLRPRLASVNVRELLSALRRQMRLRLERAHVLLSVRVDPDVEFVRADPEILRRVVENLAYNALDVAPESTSIVIEASRRDAAFALSVSDAGPGVREEEREAIFELYRRGKDRPQRGSRGLGLAFCKLAAEAMGGTIACEARPEGGVCFRLTLSEPEEALLRTTPPRSVSDSSA